MNQLVDGLGGSQLAMPVEIVQFCWKYNAERLKNLPEVAGCEVSKQPMCSPFCLGHYFSDKVNVYALYLTKKG